MRDFERFIERLAEVPSTPDTYNPYGAGDNPYNRIRRANLLRYLHDIAARQPSLALITEAPGYRGVRLTGVPMLSRAMLKRGIPQLSLFGTARGYQDVDEPGFERIQSEQSGTILWGLLAELGITPLVWNTFPLHPHKPGLPLTNRPPRRSEVQIGMTFLSEMLAIFQPAQVIAVGNVAFGALTTLGVPCVKIRHPAQGGKNAFVAGLRDQV